MEGGNGAIERIPDAEKMMLQMFEDHGNLLDDDDDDSPSYKYFNALVSEQRCRHRLFLIFYSLRIISSSFIFMFIFILLLGVFTG